MAADCCPLVVTVPRPVAAVVVAPGTQGPPGPPGPAAPGSGDAPLISEDPNNRLTQGSDDGLFVNDDLIPDPLAFYILAKG